MFDDITFIAALIAVAAALVSVACAVVVKQMSDGVIEENNKRLARRVRLEVLRSQVRRRRGK